MDGNSYFRLVISLLLKGSILQKGIVPPSILIQFIPEHDRLGPYPQSTI